MIDAMKQALGVLESDEIYVMLMGANGNNQRNAASALRQAIEQAEKQEPVAWMEMVVANLVRNGINKHMARELAHHFYTYPAPTKREWIGLTDEEIDYIWGISPGDYEDKFAFPRAIEAKLKEKNGG
jgi:hypothetical protein